ncbi:hypothetical protein [Streptomyces violaceus]|uniref:Uncharacterized protein n=1 Tax=Streptomyces violaceus TaxID=1936 RepID=A0ABY9UMM9_STRVL|nr:hypothetical protein [Streptomyces janthinus]WND24110.1 hypothetical protein RI060_43095 [Streptomyces janthinus]GGS97127.1 hypothetical protein GCM10010270_81470 [Streptomyces janthinus]
MTQRPEIHASGKRRKTLHIWPAKTLPPEGTRQQIVDWLNANGIAARTVAIQPISLEFVPGCAGSITSCDGTSSAPWWIAFTQRYTVDEDGRYEINVLTGEPAEMQRTVPMVVAPPPELLPEWVAEYESVFFEDDPWPRMGRLSEVQEEDDEDGGGT